MLSAPPLPFDAVCFDLDGTLAEVRRRRLGMWRSALRHPRILLTFGEVVEELRGLRLPDLDAELCRRLARRADLPPAIVTRVLREEIDGRWPQLFAGARPPPAVARLLQRVDALGLPRAVVSDHPAVEKLTAMGLGGWSAVLCCRDLGALKPLPDALYAAAAQLGVPVGRVLMVGDRDDTDGRMAAAAGARFVHVDALTDGADPLASA